MADVQYFTVAGLEKLKEELRLMKTVRRKEVADAIAEAREKGDLRENAEYDAAKEAQGMLEAEIARLESTLAMGMLIDELTLDTSKALITSKVTVKNLKFNKEMVYQLVTGKEADMKAGKISVDSPVGKGLLGSSVGDVVEIEVPAGVMKFEIINISYD